MKTKTILLIALCSTGVQGATSVVNLTIGQLRDSSGAIMEDAAGTWAIIVSALPGTPPTAGALPGGITNNSSLSTASSSQIKADFDGVQLTVGQPTGKNYYIHQLGGFASGDDLGIDGIVQASITFDIYSASPVESGYNAGTLWGIYWFPGQSAGSTLSGAYEVGGFANDYNTESVGDAWGTTIPSAPNQFAVNFYETNFNQEVLEGQDTGLSALRFTAVAIPEPTTLTLTALAALGLLRRRRA